MRSFTGNATEIVDNETGYTGSAATGYDNDSDSVTDLIATIVSDLLLFLLVFGMSATVDIKSMEHQFRNYKAWGTGLFLQFIILPFLGFLTVKLFNINEVSGITLLVIVSSPGGSYSNWWCALFNAELALSIAMTTISTILSIAFLPVNLYLYSRAAYGRSEVVKNLNFVSLFISIMIVIGAVALGLICSAKIKHPKIRKFANLGGNISGICLIAFSIIISMVGDGDEVEDHLYDDKDMYWSTALPCVVGLLLANVFTSALRLDKPERVTCSVECCYQNTGIATAVAISMFQGQDVSEAVKIPLWYGIVEAVALGIYLVIAWKLGYTKAPSNEKFCTVISKSYEIEADDHNSQQSVENDLCESDNYTDEEGSDVEIAQCKKDDGENDTETDGMNDDKELTGVEFAQDKIKDIGEESDEISKDGEQSNALNDNNNEEEVTDLEMVQQKEKNEKVSIQSYVDSTEIVCSINKNSNKKTM